MRTIEPKKKYFCRTGVSLCGILSLFLIMGSFVSVCALKTPPAGCSFGQKKTTVSYCFPLESASWHISDPYGWRKDSLTGKEAFHKGMDLACASGTAVLAGADGIVLAARYSLSYGNYIRICHANGEETLYAHLQYLYVRTGEVVWAGEYIGTAGQTGRATGAHLHLEWLVDGTRYDPAIALALQNET